MTRWCRRHVGVQNIAEGSQATGTSKKTELKLTNVARASLEELRLDYEDFLRQRGLALWERDDPRRQELIERDAPPPKQWRIGRGGCMTWTGVDRVDQVDKSVHSSTRSTPSTYPEIAANGALVLLAVACSLLDRQLAARQGL